MLKKKKEKWNREKRKGKYARTELVSILLSIVATRCYNRNSRYSHVRKFMRGTRVRSHRRLSRTQIRIFTGRGWRQPLTTGQEAATPAITLCRERYR